jgi:hypothetical protein
MTIDLTKLATPFPPEAVSWRVGSTNADKTKGMALAYIDSRDVQNRLDEVCGPENWQVRFPWSDGKALACEIGIRIDGEWVWKGDGAGATDVEADKGRFSDAFKRAAVHWKIGRYLYDLDSPWVALEAAGRSYKIAEGEKAKLRALLARNAPAAAQQRKPEPAAKPEAVKPIDGVDVPLIVEGVNEPKTLKGVVEWMADNRGMLGEIHKKSSDAYDTIASAVVKRGCALCSTEAELTQWLGSKARGELTALMSDPAFEVLNGAVAQHQTRLKRKAA